MKRTCKQCGKEFFISQSEINFYKEKNLNIPKRCKDCRNSNKQKKENEEQTSDTENRKYESKESSANSSKAAQSNSTSSNNSKAGTKTGSVKKYLYSAAAVVILGASAVFGKNQFENAGSKDTGSAYVQIDEQQYTFSSEQALNEHYEKHGKEMGFKNAKEYEAAASAVVNNGEALYKTEKEDGDYVYYVAATNEFVIVSAQSGYIRTYFLPSDGKAYFDRQ